MPLRATSRRYPIGAECVDGGVAFRVWAPTEKSLMVVVGRESEVAIPMQREGDGYFAVTTDQAQAGSLYWFRFPDDDGRLYPDPASRFQPHGPHGPSQVVSTQAFRWTDAGWTGLERRGQVLYEMHVGTFTPAGTWEVAAERLSHLADVGVTAIEVLPVAEFAGKFGWGYDGVDLFAPTHLYGTPDDFRRFVDRAHAAGIGVILDVVYNHLGPDGNYAPRFSPYVFTDRYSNEWGEALNFDGEQSRGVREFICANAAYWIDEFHLDGLRLDATQSIHDASATHVLRELTEAARAAAGKRSIFIVAENEPQCIEHVLAPEAGGYGMDAVWNDDFHHSALVALLGRSEAYYSDYRGTPQEFISAIKRGYLYQGQWYTWQGKRRGTSSLRVSPDHFVTFLENHDQVANKGRGQRLHQLADPATYRAMTALLLLAPCTPMLFQGQEFASSKPFLYFADHQPELAQQVWKGRREFVKQFPSLASEAMQQRVRDPSARATFEDCRLDWSECNCHVEAVALHRDLLALRRSDAVLRQQSSDIDGAVLSAGAFVLRFFAEDGADRLLLVNFGPDLELLPAPEPLLAEPREHRWELVWSSEDPQYGGLGTPSLDWDDVPKLPGHCTMLLAARRRTPA